MTRDPTRLREAMRRAPRPLEERLARTYDEEVYPLWGQRFADLMRAALPAALAGAVLEIGAGTGALTCELVRRHQGKGRVVALEAQTAFLERARTRCRGVSEVALFLRGYEAGKKLPFAEDTFDLLLAGPELALLPDADAALADLVRVMAPGALLVLATPLAGTWQEPLDLLEETLRRLGRGEARAALAKHRTSFVDPAALSARLARAGLGDIAIEATRWQLLFPSGREFFYAPIIDTGPLPDWRIIAAEGGDMLDVFVAWKDAIDTYFGDRGFAVSVLGARATARKPAETGGKTT